MKLFIYLLRFENSYAYNPVGYMERYATMPPEQKEAYLERNREQYATMPPEQKEALLKKQAESGRKDLEAGTLGTGGACAAGSPPRW